MLIGRCKSKQTNWVGISREQHGSINMKEIAFIAFIAFIATRRRMSENKREHVCLKGDFPSRETSEEPFSRKLKQQRNVGDASK